MTTASVLTRESPFARRLSAYLAERFPPLGHGVLIAAYYSSNQFLARTLTHPGERMYYDVSTLLGALALFSFFFHLRVFDEHKDYAEDRVHYPQRVLQSGLITLRDLKILDGIAIGAEIVLSALLGLAPWFYAALVALFLVCLVGFFDYRLHTSRKTAKRMELYAGIYIIAFDVILAVAIARQWGIGT